MLCAIFYQGRGDHGAEAVLACWFAEDAYSRYRNSFASLHALRVQPIHNCLDCVGFPHTGRLLCKRECIADTQFRSGQFSRSLCRLSRLWPLADPHTCGQPRQLWFLDFRSKRLVGAWTSLAAANFSRNSALWRHWITRSSQTQHAASLDVQLPCPSVAEGESY